MCARVYFHFISQSIYIRLYIDKEIHICTNQSNHVEDVCVGILSFFGGGDWWG